MKRRQLLTGLMAAPYLSATRCYAAASVSKKDEAESDSLWARFYRRPLLRRDYEDLPRSGVFVYTAQAGDTLHSLAERFYGHARYAAAIARWNELEGRTRLRAGQSLKLPIPEIGLLYSLELLTKGSHGFDLVGVDDGHEFRAGDLFRLRVSPNIAGSFYVFDRDAGGEWQRLFPDVTMDVHVERFSEYVLPAASSARAWFRLDHAEGSEELVLLLALAPLEELEDILEAPPGQPLRDAQKKSLELFLEREEKTARGISRVSADEIKKEDGAMITLGPDSGVPVLVHRIKLQRTA